MKQRLYVRIKAIIKPARDDLIIPILIAVALMTFGLNGMVSAFHSGGVGHCDGCHSMHQSPDNPITGMGNSILARGTDSSSTCLICHAGAGSPTSYSVLSSDGSAMSPGGDFYWLQKSFAWAGGSSVGENHGHNIVAMDYGLTADTRHITSPGGVYQANDLACTSCHDPHGKVNAGLPVKGSGSYGASPEPGTALGNYRLLGSLDYDGGEHVQGYAFLYNSPIAAQNPAIPYGESDVSHVDYGSGMSEWCSNCHTDILFNRHQFGSSSFEHPVGTGAFLEDFVTSYNSYVRTGEFSGVIDTSYLSLVPFERGVLDPELLDPTSTRGPDNYSNVMCLTCHRAHASAFQYGGRWDFNAQLIMDSHPAVSDVGVSGNDVIYSYYGRDMATEFGPEQRSLCEKCHEVPRSGYPPGW